MLPFSQMKRLLPDAVFLACAGLLPAAKNLEGYFIDVEGGQSTLFVSPGGESMLVDTGWPGQNHRDANRIAAAAKAAGVKKIDYLVITHFHTDHVGGVAQLVEKLPVATFVDHGGSVETGRDVEILFRQYSAYREKGKHQQVKPGDRIPVKGLEVEIVSAGGATLAAPLSGAGKPNPDCAGFQKIADETGENAQSVGMRITYGSFRMLDLGDLTWNKEFGLVCPENRLGPVDVYVVGHHGRETSGSPQLLHAISPRIAIMNNSARKGGDAAAWQIIHDTPGMEDLWQLHFAVAGGKGHNSSDTLISNVDEVCEGKWIKLTVKPDGSYTVENTRNKFSKSYARR
jgi:competence protein ComEC